MAGKRKPISDQLRDAIATAGVTRYEIAKQTGIAQSALSRFMSGERGLGLDAVDALCAYLGLELVPRSTKRN